MKNKRNFRLIALLLVMLIFTISCSREDVLSEAGGPAIQQSQGTTTTHLTGSEEVPAATTNAQGQVLLKLNAAGTALDYKLIVANIQNVRAAHLHMAPRGVNGPVVAFLYGGPTISGQTQGVLAQGTITAASVIGPIAGNFAALLNALANGNIYANVHTNQYPGGEIRGQVD